MQEATLLYSEQFLSMTTVYLSIDLDYPNKGPSFSFTQGYFHGRRSLCRLIIPLIVWFFATGMPVTDMV